MTRVNSLVRELKFAARDRAVLFWLVVVLGLSAVSVGSGFIEVERQNATIHKLVDIDEHERAIAANKLSDWGSAAYYLFHLTYNQPSSFAFAAMGQRDVQPWKHRVRMLALEGQIYERDIGNPSVALIGRFDFAFLAAFIVPLVLIMLLYGQRAGEQTAGRHDLLEATVGRPLSFWVLRTCLRSTGVFVCLMTPLIIAGIIADTASSKLALATLAIFFYILFWTVLCFLFAAWKKPGPTILMALIAIWITLAVILPAAARLAIDRLVPLPSGAEILMLQRETVNDAWDLPREVTMDAFFERHPQWSDYEPEESSFEWQWYYAFQQVGDQRAEALSDAYREGRLARDHYAARVALLTPPALIERILQNLAETNTTSAQKYESEVRHYHTELRNFYYQRLFKNKPFDPTELEKLPRFLPAEQKL